MFVHFILADDDDRTNTPIGRWRLSVNIPTISNFYDENMNLLIMDITDNPVITNPVSPKPAKWTGQCFATGSGIFQNSHTISHEIDNAPGSLFIEFPKQG